MLENLNKTVQEQVDTQLHTMVSEASKPIHTRHHSQKETSPLDLTVRRTYAEIYKTRHTQNICCFRSRSVKHALLLPARKYLNHEVKLAVLCEQQA